MLFLTATPSSGTTSSAIYILILILGGLLIAWELRQLLRKEGTPAKKFQPIDLLLGRAYHCDVRFPADTAGVSGVHCKVTVTMNTGSNSIVLADQGSTYGTFLQDGTPVTQPVWLKPGDVFFLSEGGPAIRVERSMEA